MTGSGPDMQAPAAAAPRGPWSRRWFRRLTYLLAAGGILAGATAWLAQRPEVDRWLVAQLDRALRRETGLELAAERLELHPFQGRILIHGLAVGGDLFQARLLEVDVDWASLLHTPHLRRVLLDQPAVVLDRARLARIRLRERPPSAKSTDLRLDRLELREGRVTVREPAWGLPRGDFRFELDGRGGGVNRMAVRLKVPEAVLGPDPEPFRGEASLAATVTERRLDVQQGEARLGDNRLAFKGGYGFKDGKLNLTAGGRLDLVQAQRLAQPGVAPAASGTVEFQAQAEGPLTALAWSGRLSGQKLRARDLPLQPGSLVLAAQGRPEAIRVERLGWTSPDGRVEANGSWSAQAGTRLQATVQAVPLGQVATRTRAAFLRDLTASLTGELHVPPGPARVPWSFPGTEKVSFQGSGEFHQAGQKVGRLELRLADRKFQAPALDLNLPELEVHASAEGALGPKGVASVAAEASVSTDAANVAAVLLAWDIGMDTAPGRRGPLDMEGPTRVEARLGWAPAPGFQLEAKVEATDPRWHGARADRLEAAVSIDREVLRVSDIRLEKGDGRGSGDLWLTWADLPRGSKQIDMTYRADRLPVREGLRAADVGDLELDGIGSGWVRLYGPFDRILMEGQAQAEQASVYGLRIPAAAADFAMDIEGERFQATRVRVADEPGHLGQGDQPPTGPLALQGGMDLDIKRETWTTTLAGDVDTAILGLPGPRLQGRAEARLEGPIVAPLGPIVAPPGSVTVTGARVTQSGQTLEGLEAHLEFRPGRLRLGAGLEGKAGELVRLEAVQRGKEELTGTLEVDLGSHTADTAQLASRLTGDLLKDARLRFRAEGGWGPKGLQWRGTMDRFGGQFEGFYLVQSRPGQFSGDMHGVTVDMDLEGRTPVAPPGQAPAPEVPAQAAPAPGAAAAAQAPGTATAAAAPAPGAAAAAPTPGAAAAAAAQAVPPRGSRRRPAVSATSMSLRGHLPFSAGAPLALQLAGSSNLANLKTLLDRVIQPGQYSLLADLHAEGNATFDLNLGGSYGETTLDGQLTLKGGQAVVHSYPLSLDNLDFTAQFRGRDVFIPRTAPLRGTVAQGALVAWGKLTWHLGGVSDYEVHASLEDFQMRDLPTGLEVLGSLDATLKGSDQDGGLLSGSVWAKRTYYRQEINLGDLILSSALGTGSGLSSLDPSDPLARIDLDLELHLAEPWELETNLLKLQGRPQGPFYIRGSLARPGPQGRMELLPGGRVTNLFPAGDVVLERGLVEFQDPTVFNPIVDIEGRIDIPPYLVTLNIAGALDSLQTRPFSTPYLRQEDIFAILIDPAAVNSVGGLPGSTQSAMTTGLANTGSGLLTSLALANFQEQLRRNLNLDRVSVAWRTGANNPETSITVGKTVNLFGYHTPLVFTHSKAGDVTTISGQVEWRFGNYVFRLGASQSTSDSLAPSGEVRHTWSPR